jgi:predicted neutral ceramidase superfamily lipid hydrolase
MGAAFYFASMRQRILLMPVAYRKLPFVVLILLISVGVVIFVASIQPPTQRALGLGWLSFGTHVGFP